MYFKIIIFGLMKWFDIELGRQRHWYAMHVMVSNVILFPSDKNHIIKIKGTGFSCIGIFRQYQGSTYHYKGCSTRK